MPHNSFSLYCEEIKFLASYCCTIRSRECPWFVYLFDCQTDWQTDRLTDWQTDSVATMRSKLKHRKSLQPVLIFLQQKAVELMRHATWETESRRLSSFMRFNLVFIIKINKKLPLTVRKYWRLFTDIFEWISYRGGFKKKLTKSKIKFQSSHFRLLFLFSRSIDKVNNGN
jgi:hypothetical protein